MLTSAPKSLSRGRGHTQAAASLPATRQNPPILLANADYYGTLAAVRCLGRAGIPVVVAEPRWLAPARWSRFATRHLVAPAPDDPERFMDWLLAFGRRDPGHVLYATSDEVAWLFATYRSELTPYFRMYQPAADAVVRLLDKRQLLALGRSVGLDAPTTYAPGGGTDAETISELEGRLGRGDFPIGFPLLIKPTTQVLLRLHSKGAAVHLPEQLLDRYRAFQAATRPHPMLLTSMPSAGRPVLQSYHAEAADGIYSIAGFVDAEGCVTALASRKVLQRPRRLGIGLCFESAPLRKELVEALSALCREAGYFGVFEAEFIVVDRRYLLIDFNPRFYGQMAFESDRGLPLALIAYEAALGRFDALAAAAERLGRTDALRPRSTVQRRVFTHRFVLELLTRGQGLFRRMSSAEVSGWRHWQRTHRGHITDAVLDRQDWLPALIDIAGTIYGYCRHPRDFVRTMLLNR